MALEIYIPSRGRPEKQPLAEMLMSASIDFHVVCTKGDPELYRYEKRFGDRVIVVKAKGIAEKRQKILELSGRRLVMMDDDLRLYRRTADGSRFVMVTARDGGMTDFFGDVDTALTEHAHVGVSDKFMSHTKPRGCVMRGRYNQILAYNKRLFPDSEIKFRTITGEEHDVHLQLAAHGLAPCILTEWSKDSQDYAEGGCSIWRTREVEERGLRQLQDNFPDLVSLVPHPGTKSELAIRVMWSKAVTGGGRVTFSSVYRAKLMQSRLTRYGGDNSGEAKTQ